MAEHARRHRPRASARALLAALAAGPADDVVTLRSVMEGLGGSLFGMLLFIATLPAFLPIPGVAGALSGPLVSVIGVQLLLCMRRPWLPRVIADRGPKRGTLARFEHRVSPWLKRLERVVRPRLGGLIDHPAATMVTGLLLFLLGVLLALPIPFTNYVFGLLLLAYALALLERDGALMLLAWVAGLAAIAAFGTAGGTLGALALDWFLPGR
ncbi:exopolysaccharide biosynthesis protein [Luteimonas granuli]|uniref:Exopolysaccharide biosynthesis protein n=1 Tax=Luteimonas granuli TaxID=1176533 RepID=A0A518N1K0_9GAMM|nr:exopolysaccharide biosynthesis protein [Luteimonas granuli]QDW65793.1 exopolysaccharide biosynthesis protein [Luteimonas granuli]